MDFGKILDQWENENPQKEPDDPAARRKKMESLLDKYDSQSDDTEGRENRKQHHGVNRKKLLKMKPQAKVDLHGLTVEQAGTVLHGFINESLEQSLKKVLIIHGKGYHSTEKPVLVGFVRNYIEKNPHCGEFGYAKNNEGGTGAVWVILR